MKNFKIKAIDSNGKEWDVFEISWLVGSAFSDYSPSCIILDDNGKERKQLNTNGEFDFKIEEVD